MGNAITISEENLGNQPASRRALGQRHRLIPPASRRASGARFFSFPWMAERARLLHRICAAIQKRRDAGQSLKSAIKQPAWYWSKPRFYRCDKTRRVQLGRGSLLRFYYHWLENGRSPEAFTLGYVIKRQPVTRKILRRFLKACAMPGSRSMSHGCRRMQPRPRGTFGRAITAALSPNVRATIRRIFGERRKLLLRDRQIARKILNLEARL